MVEAAGQGQTVSYPRGRLYLQVFLSRTAARGAVCKISKFKRRIGVRIPYLTPSKKLKPFGRDPPSDRFAMKTLTFG